MDRSSTTATVRERILVALSEARSIDEIGKAIVENCSNLFDAEVCTLWRRYRDDDGKEKLRLLAASASRELAAVSRKAGYVARGTPREQVVLTDLVREGRRGIKTAISYQSVKVFDLSDQRVNLKGGVHTLSLPSAPQIGEQIMSRRYSLRLSTAFLISAACLLAVSNAANAEINFVNQSNLTLCLKMSTAISDGYTKVVEHQVGPNSTLMPITPDKIAKKASRSYITVSDFNTNAEYLAPAVSNSAYSVSHRSHGCVKQPRHWLPAFDSEDGMLNYGLRHGDWMEYIKGLNRVFTPGTPVLEYKDSSSIYFKRDISRVDIEFFKSGGSYSIRFRLYGESGEEITPSPTTSSCPQMQQKAPLKRFLRRIRRVDRCR